jgi:hypothetical protein
MPAVSILQGVVRRVGRGRFFRPALKDFVSGDRDRFAGAAPNLKTRRRHYEIPEHL